MPVKRSGRKRNRKGFFAMPYSASLALATLANEVVVKVNTHASSFTRDAYIISVDQYTSLHNNTTAEGPYQLGFAHGDLTVTEIKESLEAEPIDPSDIIAREHMRRPVRKMGMLPGLLASEVLNNGVVQRTRINFPIGKNALVFWAKNRGDTANLTTGTLIKISGTIYGRWI